MTSTHETLRRIEKLTEQLTSEIVVQEEEFHYEPKEPGLSYDRMCYEGSEVQVVDVPRVAVPDTESRTAAHEQLEQIYRSSQSFRVRYRAGKALNYSLFDILFGVR